MKCHKNLFRKYSYINLLRSSYDLHFSVVNEGQKTRKLVRKAIGQHKSVHRHLITLQTSDRCDLADSNQKIHSAKYVDITTSTPI